MKHYICTGGCGGVSGDADATCQAVDCADHGKQLQSCECEDGLHGETAKSE